MEYGIIDINQKTKIPKLYLIETECIASTISGVPYHCDDDYNSALEWIFLKSKL